MKQKKGRFIVIDGIDASGKGTVALALYGYLIEKGIPQKDIVFTFEPTGGETGRKIREMLKADKKPLDHAEKCLELYIKDRKEHLKNEIIPALKEGKIVLCDRFKYSTIAYQGAQGIDMQKIIEMHKGMPIPDLTLILDIDVNIAISRIKADPKRNIFDKFEQKDFLNKVRQNFLAMKTLLPKENLVYLNASKSKEEVFQEAKKEVNKILEF